MTLSREDVRKKQWRDRHQLDRQGPPAATEMRTGGYLGYRCIECGKDRRTSASVPPVQCPTCILAARELERAQPDQPGLQFARRAS